MVTRSTRELAAGLVAAGVVAGLLGVYVATPYALAVGLAVGTPALARTSLGLDRPRYEAATSRARRVLDAALAAVTTAALGLGAGYLAVSNGYDGSVAAAAAAAAGVFGGQTAFYLRNRSYVD